MSHSAFCGAFRFQFIFLLPVLFSPVPSPIKWLIQEGQQSFVPLPHLCQHRLLFLSVLEGKRGWACTKMTFHVRLGALLPSYL